MKGLFYGLASVILMTVVSIIVSSCGSSWEISGNNMEINVLEKDTIAVLPEGTHVMSVDTPTGSMKCYMLPEKSN